MSIKKALVVDDSKSARYALKKMLEKIDVSSDFAESAGDALNYLETKQPDVIFMDHLMPGMDGFEATKLIKSNPVTKDIPVVMCTSKEGPEYLEQALGKGACAVLPKPAPMEALTSLVEELGQAAPAATETAETEAEPSLSTSVAKTDLRQRAIEHMVKSMVEDQISSIQKNVKSVIGQQIEDTVEAKLKELQESLAENVSQKVDGSLGARIAKECEASVTALLDRKADELKVNVMADLNPKLIQLEDKVNKPSQALLLEVKNASENTAQSTAQKAAAEAAKHAAEMVSKAVAKSVLQEEMGSAKEDMAQELAAGLKKAGGGKGLAFLALLVGAAAIAMHFVKF